jgi:cysteinyl-tRNA synthetase
MGASPSTVGVDADVFEAVKTAKTKFYAALSNDLNTAEARAPIFDLVRTINTIADSGRLFRSDIPAILAVLADFDAVFDVLEDRDAEETKKAIEWAQTAGRMNDVTYELIARQGLTDEKIEALVADRTQAKKQRNFTLADSIRDELSARGVVIEDSKDGVRWKRK